jgi:hypothetical protein
VQTPQQLAEICKLVGPGNSPEMVVLALKWLVPVINKGLMEKEMGSNQNLLSLLSVVEHAELDSLTRRNVVTIIYEVTRQITTEQKAIFLLQRYGISKLLVAVKTHAIDSDLKSLIEDLVVKLVSVGKNCLSVNVLFMLAQSSGISDVHPKLCKTAWEALV